MSSLVRLVAALQPGDLVTATVHLPSRPAHSIGPVPLVELDNGSLQLGDGYELVRLADGSLPGYLRDVHLHITRPGLYDAIPEAVYHRGLNTPTPSLSNSSMSDLVGLRTPAHYRHARQNPSGPRRAFDVGRAAHARVLGVGEEMAACPAEYLSVDGKMTTAKAKAWANETRAAGIVPLSPADHAMVAAMADTLADHPTAGDLLTSPTMRPEVSAYAQDPDTGVWLRGRFDVLGDGLADYKTSACAHPEAFRKSAWTYGYHRQAWLYRHLHEWATGQDAGELLFVVQEKEPPYLVSLVRLDAEFDRLAAQQVRQAIDLYAACLAADDWPGYPADVVTVSPPAYASRTADQAATDAAEWLLADLEGILR